MSIQKHFQKQPFLKILTNQNNSSNYRVRQLSRNQSLKQLPIKDLSRKYIFIKSDKNLPSETSFFLQQNNIENIHVKQEKYLPKYKIDVNKQKEQKVSMIKKNQSHRILRKIQSHQLLPQNNEIKLTNPNIKQVIKNIQREVPKTIQRDISLKKKVSMIKKSHNFVEKSNFFSSPSTIDIKSENFLMDKKKSKPKLKLLVRDPFKSHVQIDKYKNESFSQSRIEQVGRQSLMSETNRKQFQQILSCIN